MTVKYYRSQNANFPHKINGNSYTFDKIMNIGGSMQGLFRAEDPAFQKDLDQLVENRKIIEVSEEEYNTFFLKKDNSLDTRRQATAVEDKAPRPSSPQDAQAAKPEKKSGDKPDTTKPPASSKQHTSDEAGETTVIDDKPKGKQTGSEDAQNGTEAAPKAPKSRQQDDDAPKAPTTPKPGAETAKTAASKTTSKAA